MKMDDIAAWLNLNKSIQAVSIWAHEDKPIRESIYIKSSESFLNSPAHVKQVWVDSDHAFMSWTNVSLLMQHFCIISNTFPQPRTDQDMFVELKDPYKSTLSTQGFLLTVITYNDEDSWAEVDNDNDRNDSNSEETKQINVSLKPNNNQQLPIDAQSIPNSAQDKDFYRGNFTNVSETGLMTNPVIRPLHSIPELEIVSSLMFNKLMDDFPPVLRSHIWPELCYLYLYVKNIKSIDIVALNKMAPKLNYLILWIPIANIPDFVWTFDWDLLPWRTGLIFPCNQGSGNFT